MGNTIKNFKKKTRKLKYPAIYKHFKGHQYVALGISQPINGEEHINFWASDYSSENAIHTETNKEMKICFNHIDNVFLHNCEDSKEILVIYRPLYLNDNLLYARPLEMFLDKVDKEKYPNVNQLYRFEEIK